MERRLSSSSSSSRKNWIINRLEEIDQKATTTFKTRVKRMENIVAIITTIEGVRKRLMTPRRSLTPTLDMLGVVMRGAVPFVVDANLRSFRDVYDHSFQLLETIDNDRDRTSDCGISTSAFTLRRRIIRSRC